MSISKGERTRQLILEKGVQLAGTIGLSQITVGNLAKECGLSRSGLYAHFESVEDIQVSILNFAESVFVETVTDNVINQETYEEKIHAMLECWPKWYLKDNKAKTGGCIFLAAVFEYDDHEGEVKEHLKHQQNKLLKYLALIFEEKFSKSEAKQKAYQFYSFNTGFHITWKFLGHTEAKEHYRNSVLQLSGLVSN